MLINTEPSRLFEDNFVSHHQLSESLASEAHDLFRASNFVEAQRLFEATAWGGHHKKHGIVPLREI